MGARKRTLLWAALAARLLLLALAAALLAKPCDRMTSERGGVQDDCLCSRTEVVLQDSLAVDGDRSTLCLGIVKAHSCYKWDLSSGERLPARREEAYKSFFMGS